MKRNVKPIALVALITIAACVRTPISGDEMVAQCQAEAAPVGTYEYDEGAAVPVMRAIEDGTASGARKFNACIRAKAASEGLIAMSSSTGRTGAACPNGAATLYGGSTYCIGPK